MAIIVSKLKKSLFWITVILLLFTSMGQLGSFYWLFDLFSHFTIQYFFLTTLLSVVVFILDRKKYLLWFLLAMSWIFNFKILLPYYFPDLITRKVEDSFKIISLNVNSQNNNFEKVIDHLLLQKPDIVVLIEITPQWDEKISQLKSEFPHQKIVLRKDNFGIGILSKIPMENIRVYLQNDLQIPFITTEMNIRNKKFSFIAVHPFPPIGESGTLLRDKYLRQVSEFVELNALPSLVCGDLNATPWSSSIREFKNKTKMKSTSGNGIVPTWPTFLPVLKIPIDMCLFPIGTSIFSYSRGPNVGSDHYPIQIEVGALGRN